MNAPILTRRGFNKAMAGLVLTFSLDPAELLAQGASVKLPGSLAGNKMLNAWVAITGDGNAVVHTGKVELGQGILTALAQIAAEELDLPLDRVTIYSADTAQSPNEGQTAGSQSIENSGTALRYACAEARGIMVDFAAGKLGVTADALTVKDGVVSTADGRKLGYEDIIQAVNFNREATGKVQPKPTSAYKIVGQSAPRRDIPGKVTGRISYVQDVYETGMVHGRVVRPPRYGSTLESVDAAAIEKMPGVIKVVRDGSFLGVVAEREEQAVWAREALAQGREVEARPRIARPGEYFCPSEIAAQQGQRDRRQAGAGDGERQHALAGGDLHQALSGARLDRAVLRDGDLPQQPDDRLDALARGVSAARRAGEGAEDAGQGHSLHPRRRLGLLRPERRRRRGARCGAAGPRRAGQAGAAAMDARRRVRLGALRRGDVDERQGVARCRWQDRRLAI